MNGLRSCAAIPGNIRPPGVLVHECGMGPIMFFVFSFHIGHARCKYHRMG